MSDSATGSTWRASDSETSPFENEHLLVRVVEYLPGEDPTGGSSPSTARRSYRVCFWRCRHCGQERCHRSDFRETCPAETPPTLLSKSGYSIDDARTRRALSEEMDVRFGQIGPLYDVHSESGNTYEVDVSVGTCTCPDFVNRGDQLREVGGCKHLRRVRLGMLAGVVPQPNGTFGR